MNTVIIHVTLWLENILSGTKKSKVRKEKLIRQNFWQQKKHATLYSGYANFKRETV